MVRLLSRSVTETSGDLRRNKLGIGRRGRELIYTASDTEAVAGRRLHGPCFASFASCWSIISDLGYGRMNATPSDGLSIRSNAVKTRNMQNTSSKSVLSLIVSFLLVALANALYANCTAEDIVIPNATVVSVGQYSRGDVIPLPYTVPSCGGPFFKANATNDLCRIVVNVSTSDSSSVRVEAWFPQKWNRRLLATGTGGQGGCVDYLTVQNGAHLGFASFGTNAGHDGEAGFDFFLGKPEVIKDFGHRAIHVEAQVAKQMVEQYYGRAATKSYYQGCSTGGRQGLQNAQLYPNDFDGILVGAPGIDWLHIVASKGILARRIGWPDISSAAYVRPEQWPAIVAKQVELLDPLDGVQDGIIDDPTKYSFDPELLVCGTGLLNSTMCLNPHQVASVRAAYQPLANSKGQIVYPAFDLGADTSVFSANQVNGTAQLTYTILQVRNSSPS
ncbi:hypothetical protein N0V84_006350 [Fusarium piperis]|uniref:Carboxylic ester hydrolase n=1 Tax=Fusarium piperis TaxID=1435070 RepID=A0A9W9BPQ8_9HYPO|nr:hypothetical protein N0V84_006350 [Fusarium piperis]